MLTSLLSNRDTPHIEFAEGSLIYAQRYCEEI